MKKSVKRNARKSAKKNARKGVSTRKIKQRGGTNLLLPFICICLTIVEVLSKKVSFNELFKGRGELTNYQICLKENDNNEDPFTVCDNKPMYKYESDILMRKTLPRCIMNNENLDVDEAARECYREKLFELDTLEKKKEEEKCIQSLFNNPTIDANCQYKVFQFNYEEKMTIKNKKSGTTDIYDATIPLGKTKTMQSLVIGNENIGFFTSTELKKSTEYMKEINTYFNKAMNVVTKYMSTYLQKIVFFPNETRIRFIDDSSVVLEFNNIPREIFDSLSDEHLKLLGKSEESTVSNVPNTVSNVPNTVFNVPKTVSKKGK